MSIAAQIAIARKALTHTDTKVAVKAPALTDSALADLIPGRLTLERLCDESTLSDMRLYPIQRALVRAADGTGVSVGDRMPVWTSNGVRFDPLTQDQMITHLGTTSIPAQRPKVIIPMAGVRAGKTRIAALGLLNSTLTCSMRHTPTPEEIARGVMPESDGMIGIAPGERVKAFIVAPRERQGAQAFSYVVGALRNSQRLRKCIVEDSDNKQSIEVRRPCDGVIVSIEIIAASPMGTNIRSSWLAGIIYDESAFWGDDEGAVNLKDNVDAGTSRLLPDAQAWLPSSAWADSGYYFELHKDALRAQAEGRWTGTVAFWSDSITLNPRLDPAEITAAYAEDPVKASREFGCIPLSSLSNLFFPPSVLDPCVNRERPQLLAAYAGITHTAGVDIGYRRNSSTLAIARTRPEDGVTELAYFIEKVPPKGQPLKPSVVTQEFAETCLSYGCLSMRGDLHGVDSTEETLANLNLGVDYDEYHPTLESNAALFTRVRELMVETKVDLPHDPRLLSQFKKILGRPVPGGRWQIILPKQGQAHGDLAIAVAHAITQSADLARTVPFDPKWDGSLPKMTADGWEVAVDPEDTYELGKTRAVDYGRAGV